MAVRLKFWKLVAQNFALLPPPISVMLDTKKVANWGINILCHLTSLLSLQDESSIETLIEYRVWMAIAGCLLLDSTVQTFCGRQKFLLYDGNFHNLIHSFYFSATYHWFTIFIYLRCIFLMINIIQHR